MTARMGRTDSTMAGHVRGATRYVKVAPAGVPRGPTGN